MKRKMYAGTTSVELPIFIQDSTSSSGAGLGSLVYNTASLVAEYRRKGSSSWTAISLVTATLGTYTSGGFIADGSLTGAYAFYPPDACFASGVPWVAIRLRGAANMVPVLIEIELDAVNYQDSVRLGLTALPNAAAGSSGGMPTVDANNAVKLQSGTGANQISLTSGLVTLAAVTHTGATIPTVTNVGTVTTLTGYTSPPSALAIGAAVWADTVGLAVKASTDKIPASPAAVGSPMTLDLTQDVPARDVSAKTTSNIGDCLAASMSEAAGAESVVGTAYTKKNINGTTFRLFALNDATNPTVRS